MSHFFSFENGGGADSRVESGRAHIHQGTRNEPVWTAEDCAEQMSRGVPNW